MQQFACGCSVSAVFHTPGVPGWGNIQSRLRSVHPDDGDACLSIGTEHEPSYQAPLEIPQGLMLGARDVEAAYQIP